MTPIAVMHKKDSDKHHAKNHDISHIYYVSTTWDCRSAFKLINNMRSECDKLQTQYHHQCVCQKESGPFLTKRRTFFQMGRRKGKRCITMCKLLTTDLFCYKKYKNCLNARLSIRHNSGEKNEWRETQHTLLPEGHVNTTNISPRVCIHSKHSM